ncbi:MAG: LptF/LptG family permease [Gemmatimonadetes bacterium]|nr:LptF/LptG family permease [Gemmatimonadota bacterium]
MVSRRLRVRLAVYDRSNWNNPIGSFVTLRNSKGWLDLLAKTLLWTAILMAVPVVAQLLSGPPPGESWSFWTALEAVTIPAGLFLPFAAFGGGLAAAGRVGLGGKVATGLVIASLALVLGGVVSPHLEYRNREEVGLDLERRYPTGPRTLIGLLEVRERIKADPPEEFTFSIEQPLRHPPNWLTVLFHSRIARALFAIFSVFLGSLTASLTTGLSPPARKNARWAVGLVFGVLFFLAQAAGGDWVRADPRNSGILGAWVPMLVPVLGLAGLYLLLVRARIRATVSHAQSSDG